MDVIYALKKSYSLAGAFGKVFEGTLNDLNRNIVDVTVAIKTIKSTYKYLCTIVYYVDATKPTTIYLHCAFQIFILRSS